ncbi:uncharacterized protein FOMMEDRAFT_160477 [Fomitiporia mediterranea MF3/22]|uniref:uncharacterized protein n=1 Tax=Fomitiporia mediterranea (strain MF3/22) TaxID=694068 RepID=UPI0004407E02|nr:uncharacterized protein FOMMEDRAFT_160477 [Fomitiporia mediterranea MF3/22]EJC99429.1 hypothetical protein FOMMEDRAFT_160477 [Fomitiporia mediterranea MF3/22]
MGPNNLQDNPQHSTQPQTPVTNLQGMQMHAYNQLTPLHIQLHPTFLTSSTPSPSPNSPTLNTEFPENATGLVALNWTPVQQPQSFQEQNSAHLSSLALQSTQSPSPALEKSKSKGKVKEKAALKKTGKGSQSGKNVHASSASDIEISNLTEKMKDDAKVFNVKETKGKAS